MSSSELYPLPVGHKLASNTILKLLGQGEYGATYLVSDVRAEGDVSVIKESLPAGLAYREPATMQLLPQEASGEGVEKLRAAQEAFTSEAKALETIHHPSIVAVSRVFSALGTTYATMEYLPGFTVAEWCEKNGAPTREQLVYLLTTLLSALSCLHAKGMAHGDLREEHVRFRANGIPVLLDFGIARKSIQASGSSSAISALNRSAEDLFALGAMARRIITGEKGATGGRVAPLVKDSKLVSAYGRSLLAGIDKAMNTNEGKGWANADEWLDAVKGRILSSHSRKLVRRAVYGTIAAGILSVGAYQLVQYALEDAPSASIHEPTQEEIAQDAYTKGMDWLQDKPTRTADPTKAIPLLTKAAKLGHAEAMWALVRCYTEGTVAEPDSEKAFKWCKATVKASPGNAEARYLLAHLYREGIGTEKDAKAALPHLTKAAEAGLVNAQYDLAVCYTTDEAGREDLEEAAKWFAAAGEQGHTGAMMELARRYREGKAGIAYTSHQDSLKWYNKAAQAGVPEAWYHIALAHWEGSGTPKDREQAAANFRKAAELGVAEAAYRLGTAIARGDVQGTPAEAETFLKQAADKGLPEAQLALAGLYVRGIDGQRKEAEAVPYFLLAAQAGKAEAACGLAGLWLSGYREGCTEAELGGLLTKFAATSSRAKLFSALLPGTPRADAMKRLEELSAEASENDVKADAMAYHGLMHPNKAIAMDFYAAAAKNGSPLGEALMAYASLMDGAEGQAAEDALRILNRGADSRVPYRPLLLTALGEVYLKGKGTPQNTDKARECLEQAAATGELKALHMLAAGYWDGSDNFPQDKAKAVETYKRAAAAGSIPAATFLGHYFFTGEEGREPSTAEAEPYLATAAQAGDARSMYEYAYCLNAKQPQDAKGAAEWAAKAADAAVPEASLLLAQLYEAGQGVELSAEKAQQALTRYADTVQGKQAPAAGAAWDKLGTMYAQGTGTEPNADKARECWGKAADAKNADGQYHYGLLLYTEGKNKNEKDRGKSLLLAAAKAGQAEAAGYVEQKGLNAKTSTTSSGSKPSTSKPSGGKPSSSKNTGGKGSGTKGRKPGRR